MTTAGKIARTLHERRKPDGNLIWDGGAHCFQAALLPWARLSPQPPERADRTMITRSISLLLLACTLAAAGCTASPTASRDTGAQPRFSGHTFGSGNLEGDSTSGVAMMETTGVTVGNPPADSTGRSGHTLGSGN
jgi:hypothetical protein